MIADEPTFARLMAAAQRGDRHAYSVFLGEAMRWLQRYFKRRVPREQVDDLIQEVLMAVHRKRATYDPARPFLPWLAAIARYRWVDHLRKVYEANWTALGEDDIAVSGDDEAVIAAVSLERLLADLPKKQAAAIELVKIEGHSISDAAALCGQSEALVKVNIHRGLKKLSALVEKG